jgi:hypothetical protein
VEQIDDAGELARVRRQALAVHLKSAATAVVLTLLLWALPVF